MKKTFIEISISILSVKKIINIGKENIKKCNVFIVQANKFIIYRSNIILKISASIT